MTVEQNRTYNNAAKINDLFLAFNNWNWTLEFYQACAADTHQIRRFVNCPLIQSIRNSSKYSSPCSKSHPKRLRPCLHLGFKESSMTNRTKEANVIISLTCKSTIPDKSWIHTGQFPCRLMESKVYARTIISD